MLSNPAVKDINCESKPLANYRTSSYLSNGLGFIPYNAGTLNGNATISASGLYLPDLTSNLTLTPTFNDAADWTLSFRATTTNTSASSNLWTYTATGSTANNKSLFINTSNAGEVVFRVGTGTDYNTGMYVTDAEECQLTVTKGTYGTTANVVSFYKDGRLTGRQAIALTNDGPTRLRLGPCQGTIQDFRLYSTQLNQTQIQQLGQPMGPIHLWRFDDSNTATTVVRDLGSAGTNLVLTNATLRNVSADTNYANSAVSTGSLFLNLKNA